MLKIWGRRTSSNVQKVLWLIGELNIAHEQIDVGGRFGGLDRPDFLAMNPTAKIPVVRDSDGTTIWESHSILRYLAAKYCTPTTTARDAHATAVRAASDGAEPDDTAAPLTHTHSLWSTDPAIQSRADRWMDWAQTALQPAFLMGVFWGYYRTPENQRDWPAIERSLKQCAQHFRVLDDALAQHDYLAGDHLTLADIAVGSSLFRYFELDIERPQFAHVQAWYDRLCERPAYRTHVMVPFDELRGRLDF